MTAPADPAPILYTLPERMLQAIVDYLNMQPAGQVRHLLNAIEAEARRQDSERQAAPEP